MWACPKSEFFQPTKEYAATGTGIATFSASSMNAREGTGTSAATSPVAGLKTGERPLCSTRAPLMKWGTALIDGHFRIANLPFGVNSPVSVAQ